MKRFHKGCTATLIVRLVIGAVFLYHGITKLMMPAAGMMDFVGSAATDNGLTFFSNETWFRIVAICETVGGAMILLGLATRVAAAVLAVVMLFAITKLGWTVASSEFEMVLLGILISLIVSGSKRYSLDHLLCHSRHGEDMYRRD